MPPQFVESLIVRLVGTLRARLWPPPSSPYFVIGKRWVPGLLITKDRRRELFLRIADRLRSEFGATVVEEFGGHQDNDKEYWTIEVAGSRLLLMRTYYPVGIGLCGNSWEDFATIEAVARAFGAKSIGWRWRAFRLRHWFRRRGYKASRPARADRDRQRGLS